MSDIRIPRHKKYFIFEFLALFTFFIVINDYDNKSNLRTGSAEGAFLFESYFSYWQVIDIFNWKSVSLYQWKLFLETEKKSHIVSLLQWKVDNNEYEVLIVTEMKNVWAFCTRDCLDQRYCNSFSPALRNQSYTSICKLWKDMLCS